MLTSREWLEAEAIYTAAGGSLSIRKLAREFFSASCGLPWRYALRCWAYLQIRQLGLRLLDQGLTRPGGGSRQRMRRSRIKPSTGQLLSFGPASICLTRSVNSSGSFWKARLVGAPQG